MISVSEVHELFTKIHDILDNAMSKLGSISMCKRDLYQSLVVPLWQKGLTWSVELRLIKVPESLLMVVSLPFLLTLGRKGVIGMAFLMCYSPQPHHYHLHLLYGLVHFPNF